MSEFVAFPKIPRYLNERCTITEKVDGTNACIAFDEFGAVTVQSRKRIITPDDDNYGFAGWVYANEAELFGILGAGRHFGEFYGQGIQRRYGLEHRGFALFAVHRWGDLNVTVNGIALSCVPVLTIEAPFTELADIVEGLEEILRLEGSKLNPGRQAEGLMIYLHETQRYIKHPFDPMPKGATS